MRKQEEWTIPPHLVRQFDWYKLPRHQDTCARPTTTFPVRPPGPPPTPVTTEARPYQSGPASLFLLGDSLCGPSPSLAQVSPSVSCTLPLSYCSVTPWHRGPCGGLTSCSGCRHPELPTRLRDLTVGSWGVVFFGGGCDSCFTVR